MTDTRTPSETTPQADRSAYAVFGALTGIISLLIVLQGLWAGIFIGQFAEGRHDHTWVDVHNYGASATLLFSLLSVGWAVWRLRARTELLVGALVLLALLVVEQVLGTRIRDDDQHGLTAVHVPLAMIALALSVWLPLRARAGRA